MIARMRFIIMTPSVHDLLQSNPEAILCMLQFAST
jgi:hypothetical protein